ncbi:MAG: hypothetical protein NTW74_19120 [Acidobacteria bacterium]|nr:hypothetical protein [Acidobacteriota bacterium]
MGSIVRIEKTNHAEEPRLLGRIVAESAGADRFVKRGVGGGDDADVGVGLFDRAKAIKGSCVEYAEKLGLETRVEGTDFVEKKAAVVGQFEEALLGGVSTGEGAALVAEEFRFDEAIRQCGAGEVDEGLLLAGGEVVDGAGYDLFARTRFTHQENGSTGLRSFADLL